MHPEQRRLKPPQLILDVHSRHTYIRRTLASLLYGYTLRMKKIHEKMTSLFLFYVTTKASKVSREKSFLAFVQQDDKHPVAK